jgi:glycosyltransferase involved in cell wall biosynthesis
VVNLSVVIPTLNEETTLPRLLDDIAKQTVLPNEIIMVDGHSEDTSVKTFTQHCERLRGVNIVVKECRRDVAAQRNLGAMKATGDVICFLDADSRLPDDDFFEESVQVIDQSNAKVWCPRFEPDDASWKYRWFYKVFNFLFWFSSFSQLPAGGGMCLFARRPLFKEFLFPEDQPFEDLQFIADAGGAHGYGILPTRVTVSTRRFEIEGYWHTLWTYVRLSWQFARRQPLTAVEYDYEFRNNSTR